MTTSAAATLCARLSSHERLAAIGSYDILDPDLRHELDLIAESSALELDHPAAAVTIVLDSAQFFAGSYGVTGWPAYAQGTPAEWSFCAHTVLSAPPYLVSDASTHPVHRESPLVTEGQRSYAGVPLVTSAGQVIGAHCVMDTRPRCYTDRDVTFLQAQSSQIMCLLREYPGRSGVGGLSSVACG
jgi:GAF domain-containing protein